MERDITQLIENPIVESKTVATLSDGLRTLLNKLFFESPLRPLKNFFNGGWFEHPLHAVITDIPIGGWTIAVVLDLLSLVFGVRRLGRASAIALAAGTLGALGATVTG